MDLDTATDLMAHASEDISTLRQDLAQHHWEHPQRAALADLAMKEIELALEKLAALGHRFFLTFQPSVQPVAFPSMIYRDGPAGLENMTVQDQGELDVAMNSGWRTSQSVEAAPAPGAMLYRVTSAGMESRNPTSPEDAAALRAAGWSSASPPGSRTILEGAA